MDSTGNSGPDALGRLRLKVVGAACILGAATAYLTFTSTGLVVLTVATAVAAALSLWLWRARPDLFASAVEHVWSSHDRVPPSEEAPSAMAAYRRDEREPATPRMR
jgi:hypothetical protein